MLQEVVLPQLGQTMEEGTIEKWHKAEGERIKKGEILFELTTDKATLEVESFVEGVVKKILVEEGQTVAVNELIAIVGDEEDELPEDIETLKQKARKPSAPPEGPVQPAEAAEEPEAATEGYEPEAPGPKGRIFASPRARKIAREKHVPLSVLRGTGPGGRIVQRDVLSYIERLEGVRHTPAARLLAYEKGVDLLAIKPAVEGGRITKEDVLRAAQAPAGAGRTVPLSPMRHTIARRMTVAKQTVPHFYLIGQVVMRKVLELRAGLNTSGTEVSLTALLVKAAALALKDNPKVNARFEKDHITYNERVNVGVAVAVEDGLFVPVIRDADAKKLEEISSELKQLVQTARQGKLIPEQYEGGSLTLSNLGMFGVDYFLPIINPPESCIIGIGQIADAVVVRDGAIAIEPVMKVSLSADHRVIDGAEAAKFFQTFREALENPERLGQDG